MHQKRFSFNKPINTKLESIHEEPFGKKNYTPNNEESYKKFSKRQTMPETKKEKEPSIIVKTLIDFTDSEIFENFSKFGKIWKIFKEEKLNIYKITYQESNSVSFALNYFFQRKDMDLRVEEFKEDSRNNLTFGNLIYSNSNFFAEKEINNRRRTFMDSDIRKDKFDIGKEFEGNFFLFLIFLRKLFADSK